MHTIKQTQTLTSLVFFAFLLVFSAGLVGNPKVVNAQGWTTLGGSVLSVTQCTCSAAQLVIIGPPKIAITSYIPGTQGYLEYTMPLATYALGWHAGVTSCYFYVGTACSPWGETTILPIVGSSL
jgi:hypothetical protein